PARGSRRAVPRRSAGERAVRHLPRRVRLHRVPALLATVVADRGWLCHACCLMPNHYNALLGTPEPNLATGMHQLNGPYGRRLTGRYDRAGHVFQGPYFSEPVIDDEHLMEVFRYLALNPVRAGLCPAPEDWPWSSYAATAGLAEPPSFLTLELARSL